MNKVTFGKRRINDLLRFMQERQRISFKRARGDPPPWTRDAILREYRFTNIYRECDVVTAWIDTNVRKPYAHDPDLWFMLCLSRAVNEPATIADLISARGAWPADGTWSEAAYRRVLESRRSRGLRFANPAYITLGTVKWMGPLWKQRVFAKPYINAERTMAGMHSTLTMFRGMGSFVAGQVVADMRFTRYLRDAPDKLTWTARGPGSMRGLNRIVGRDVDARWTADEFAATCARLYGLIMPRWIATDFDDIEKPFELHEIENSLCEFDKYERARLGEGRPKQKYHYGQQLKES